MFDFFKKKKKNTTEGVEQNTSIIEETVAEVKEVPVAAEVMANQDTEAPQQANIEENTTATESNQTDEAEKTDEPPKEVRPPDINIRISRDSLTAYIKVKIYSDEQTVTEEDVLTMLANTGIKNGIKKEEIKAYCESKEYYNEVVVAEGSEPVAGADGFIEYMFETDDGIKLVENEAGVVNFRELNVIKSVRAGDVLCKATPPTEGQNGINVYGEAILPKAGKPADIKSGENTELSANGLELKAAADGCIDYNKSTGAVGVTELYNVRGDVNSAVGNLDCLGSIIINGDVREGFIVKAKKDILIKGVIEGAHIIAGGTITISNGMNGMGIGTIEAGGDIISKYFENTEITSTGGSVYSDVIINSNVNANQAVVLKGGKGSLIGGNCTAGKMVYAAVIGARTNAPTSVTIESKEFRDALIPDQENVKIKEALRADLVNLEADKVNVEGKLAELQAVETDDPAIVAARKELGVAVVDVNAEIAAINKKIEEISSSVSALGEYKIVATKTCYNGVKITMAYLYMHCVDDYAATKFFVSEHKITPGLILPSDKLN